MSLPPFRPFPSQAFSPRTSFSASLFHAPPAQSAQPRSVTPHFQGIYRILPEARRLQDADYMKRMGDGDEITGLIASGLEPVLADGFSRNGKTELDFYKSGVVCLADDAHGDDVTHLNQGLEDIRAEFSRQEEKGFFDGYLHKARTDGKIQDLSVEYSVIKEHNILDALRGHALLPPALRHIAIERNAETGEIHHLAIHRLKTKPMESSHD
jgi:hypothetical protein